MVNILCECLKDDCNETFEVDPTAALNLRINKLALVARAHIDDDDEIVFQHVAWVAIRPVRRS